MDDLFSLADRLEAAELAAKAAGPWAPARARGGEGRPDQAPSGAPGAAQPGGQAAPAPLPTLDEEAEAGPETAPEAEAQPDLDPAAARARALADPGSIHPSLWRASQLAAPVGRVVPSALAALDAQLPGGGWPEGALTELILKDSGIGELSLLRPALRAAAAANRPIWLVGCPHAPNAMEFARDGLVDRVRWIKAEKAADLLWACETILRSNALGALVAWLPRARPEAIRRLQGLAASTDALAFAVRAPAAAQEASAATLRLALSPAPGGILRVEILKRRGPAAKGPLLLDIQRPAYLAELRDLRERAAAEAGAPAASPALPLPVSPASPVPAPTPEAALARSRAMATN